MVYYYSLLYKWLMDVIAYIFSPQNNPAFFFKKLTLLPPLGLEIHSGEFARPSDPSPVKHRCISANAPKKARFAFRRQKRRRGWHSNHSYTAWKLNSSPLKIYHPKRKVVFQPSLFRAYVKLQEGIRSMELGTQMRRMYGLFTYSRWTMATLNKGKCRYIFPSQGYIYLHECLIFVW